MASKQSNENQGPIGLIAKGVTGLIGLGTEIHKYRKDQKAAAEKEMMPQQEKSLLDPKSLHRLHPSSHRISEGDDEKLQQLDEISDEIDADPPAYDDVVSKSALSDSRSVGDMASRTSSHAIRPLPDPIILPQRRPGSKARGFIRAYPPSIGEHKGIDQSTFLGFLKEFHQQSQASHIFEVIIVGAEGGKWVPGAIAFAVGTSVQIAALGARELHGRYRTNNYLNKINEDLFHPVNLHAMIMAFDPDATSQTVVDVDTSSGMSALASSTHASGLGSKFKVSQGTTRSEAELVHAAPLVFPSIDKAMTGQAHGSSNQSGKVKRAGKFLADYLDRRAQAQYAAEHGADSALAVPGAMDSSRFASKFSDPNNPASTGNLRALLSIDNSSSHSSNVPAAPGEYGSSALSHRAQLGSDDRKRMKHENHERSKHHSAPSQDGQAAPQNQNAPQSGGPMAGISKFLKPGILYLLIAEMPSPEDLKNITVRQKAN